MTKELVDSFRKGGLKYRLQRDEDGLWSVRTDKQVFSGNLGELDAFCREQGIEFHLRGREAVSEPINNTVYIEGELKEIDEDSEIVEPELEVVAVLEEAESRAENINIKFVDEAGNDVKLKEVFDKTVELTKEKIEEANEKEAEIARLKAQLEALEK